MATAKKETPMGRQWREIRASLPEDALLFFRLGDFYELFDEDAQRAAHLLELTLTRRNGRSMCGVPHHASKEYIARALKHGYRVAIADQVGEVKAGKLVERKVSQIISAGSLTDATMLEPSSSNWLAALKPADKQDAIAILDISTGAFQLLHASSSEHLNAILARYRPSEIIYPDSQRERYNHLANARLADEHAFEHRAAQRLLKQHYQVNNLDSYGLSKQPALISVAGAALHYLTLILRQNAQHLRPPQIIDQSGLLQIDAATQSSLEILHSSSGKKHSLLGCIDHTQSAGGSRMLKQWLTNPLCQAQPIQERQQLIGALLHHSSARHKLRQALKASRDVERCVARLSQGSGNGRDLLSLADSLDVVVLVANELNTILSAHTDQPLPLASQLHQQLPELPELRQQLHQALSDEPPVTLKEGGLIRDGHSTELDQLRAAMTEGREWLADMQQRLSQELGIRSLKVKYNAVFGYFLEVTKTQLDKVPQQWVRKQTTANSERYITEELKRLEDRILGAEERSRELEYNLFTELRDQTLTHLNELQQIATALSQLDVLSSLAEVADNRGWSRPQIADQHILEVHDGRHPVLDNLNTLDGEFIPNDTHLDTQTRSLQLITGPNMAGKSTYIRQNALLVILAQIGSYVPAKQMRFGLADRVFARVGASDDLASGQSTFMVEMTEAAAILHQATERSLIILDEVGRGTATWDGLSLAWSIAEHIHDQLRSRTFFATHYHELNALQESCPRAFNTKVSVYEGEGNITFLHKIVEGSANRSYGIHVAGLAGLPESVLTRAKTILQGLETNHQPSDKTALPKAPAKKSTNKSTEKSPSKKTSPKKAASKKTPSKKQPPAEPQPDLFQQKPPNN